MKTIKLQFLILFVSINSLANAQIGPAIQWTQYPGGDKKDGANFILNTSDGGTLVLGHSNSNNDDANGCMGKKEDPLIFKYSSNGSLQWKLCNSIDKVYKTVYQAIEVPDGYLIVGSISTVGSNTTLWLQKLTKSGGISFETNWSTLGLSSQIKSSQGFCIHRRPDGSILIGGRGEYSTAFLAHFTLNLGLIRLTTSGSGQTWGSSINEIRTTSDGQIQIMGSASGVNETGCFGGELNAYGDVWLAKLNNNHGIIWSRTYGGTGYDVFVDGEINQTDQIYVIGRTYCKTQITGPNNVGGNRRMVDWAAPLTWLMRVNNQGNLLNIRTINNDPDILDNSFDYHAVTVDCNGLPVIGGSGGGFIGAGARINKLSADLQNFIWYADIPIGNNSNNDIFDLHFTNDARYIACGIHLNYLLDDQNYYIIQTEKDPDCAGSGNKCTDITPISCGQTYLGNTSGRTSRFSISDFAACHSSSNNFSGGDQLFEVYKPNSNGDLVVTLFSTAIDHDIFLLSSCNPTICLSKSTNAPSTTGSRLNLEVIRMNNAPAGYYYIVVDGPNTAAVGAYTLTVNCGILDCVNAKPMACKQKLTNESNQTGANNVSLYCNPQRTSDDGVGCTGKEKVYTFTLNSTQSVTISLTNIRNQLNDFELFLFSDCNEDVCLGTSTNPAGMSETIPLTLSAGKYYVVVDGWREAEGNYDIMVDWNCCNNPVEVYNCGYVTYSYSGNGSNLQYTFTSNRPIAPGTRWKIGNNEISNATGTSFNYLFPGEGEYIVCFPYLNGSSCVEYCCYRIWITNPFNCFLWDYKFNPTSNNFTFELGIQGASNITWKDDSSGGTIGGGPISNPIPAPGPGSCIEKTITVTYFWNGRWYICCRKLWLCNPFDCFQFDYSFDPSRNGMVFNLNAPGASNITWKDDGTGGDIGGGPISDPVPVPPNPGDCKEYIISAKYFWNGRWYICCRRVWICNPFDCFQFDYSFDPSRNGMVFNLNAPGANNITWKDDGTGGDIGGGPISDPVPVPPNPGDCKEYIITAKYFWNGRWYVCCRKVWICNPFQCADFVFRYDPNSKGYVFTLNQSGAGNVTWKDDSSGGDIGGGGSSNPVPVPPSAGGCIEKIITARYFWNNRWYICCKRVWLCDPKYCESEIAYQINGNGRVNLSVSSGYSEIKWTDQATGQNLGTGSNISMNYPLGSDQTICVQYFNGDRYYTCCRTIRIVSSSINENQNDLYVYPVPADEFLIIKSQGEIKDVNQIKIVDLLGKSYHAQINSKTENSILLDISNLKVGIYYLNIQTNSGQRIKRFEKM